MAKLYFTRIPLLGGVPSSEDCRTEHPGELQESHVQHLLKHPTSAELEAANTFGY